MRYAVALVAFALLSATADAFPLRVFLPQPSRSKIDPQVAGLNWAIERTEKRIRQVEAEYLALAAALRAETAPDRAAALRQQLELKLDDVLESGRRLDRLRTARDRAVPRN